MPHGDILQGKPSTALPPILGPPCPDTSAGLFVPLPDAFHCAEPRPQLILGAGLLSWMPDAGEAAPLIVLDVTSTRQRLGAPSVAVPDRL